MKAACGAVSRLTCALATLLWPAMAHAGQEPAPVAAAPVMATREADGHLTVHAVRLTSPLRVDGRLDEDLYTSVAPLTDLIQTEPHAGTPGTERTEVWVAFDKKQVYVAFRCWEEDPGRRVATELRHDNNLLVTRNDNAAFGFDTYHDQRSSWVFIVSPNGARVDGQASNDRQWNGDLNPIWDLQVGRFEGGWTLEAAIPFKSLRYRPGSSQDWGFTARRISWWKNEIAYITRVPDGSNITAIMRPSFYATLAGIEVPSESRTLELKPYAVGEVSSDVTATPRISNDAGGDAGLDVKYGVTENLTADFTYNTDFAQVEADEQQVNLTRFSLFFPEKREFFLENQGTFTFGGAATAAADTPTLFYSRRIGLDRGRIVPIVAGGRLTGRVGRFTLGAISIQSGENAAAQAPSTNFTVMRLKRDLFRRSSIGGIFTHRSAASNGRGLSDAFGVDGGFSFFDNLTVNTYWARTRNEGLSGEDTSYRAQLDYNADRYGLQVERLAVGDSFNPDIGFVRRYDMRRSFGLFRFSPRPAARKTIRKLSWTGSIDYIENGRGQLESRDADGEFSVEFENGDKIIAGATGRYEMLPRPFPIATGVTIPEGAYGFSTVRAGFNFGQRRRVFGNLLVEHGEFYDGRSTILTFRAARLEVSPRLSLEPNVSLNRVAVSTGSFTARLVGSRVTYTMTPLMFASALLQYNSSTNALSSNIRLRWEYRPGSELFVVYNEQRDTLARRFPDLANRAFIVKINRLFRF